MVIAHRTPEYEALLYPLMVIAAVAVMVFSLLGIASISGWLPSALLSRDTMIEVASTATSSDGAPVAAFGCAECGVIETVNRVTDTAAR